MLLFTVVAHAATLTADGSCPGRMDLRVDDATPSGAVVMVLSGTPGDAEVPGGLCAGAALGLSPDGLTVVFRRSAGPDGGLLARPTLGPDECGASMIAFDLETCTASPTIPLGEPMTEHRTDYAAMDAAVVPEVAGDGTTTLGAFDGAPADLHLAPLNGLGVVGGRSDRDVDDGESVHVLFDAPAWRVALVNAMANDLDADGVLGAVRIEAVDGRGDPVGPWPGTIADLRDATGWLGVDTLRELHVTAVGDSFRVDRVTHLEAP